MPIATPAPQRRRPVGSVVFESDGVRGDVHLRFVLGDVDIARVGANRGTKHSAAVDARAIKLLIGRQLATRTGELHVAETNAGQQTPDRPLKNSIHCE